MASSSKKLQPTQDGEYGQEDNKPQGGLLNKSFKSRCPPIVTPDSTIIAVCGPNDYLGNASPEKDGWFYSDFYLFHHLLRGTAKRQHWLTCVKPQDLIHKYKEYVHGDPRSSDRRVVLDKTFERDLEDVIVFHPNDLLEGFLSYITHACKETENSQHPVLILLFGHGEEDIYSVTIGGAEKFETCPILTQDEFKKAIYRHNSDPNIALLTTACYGGGWTHTSFLNMTAMAGIDESNELLSWPESQSLSRCCGSRYATGVAQALIRSEIQGLDLKSDEGYEARQSPTYAALVETIHDILLKEIDVREQNFVSFSAKDDIWEMEWRARTGFPLTVYEKSWRSLRVVPTGATTGQSLSASIRFSDSIYLSVPEAEHRLKRLVFIYMKSHPGDPSAAKNHQIHSLISRLVRGKHLTKEELELFAGSLRYRLLTIMRRATEFKDRLNISFLDCNDCDIITEEMKLDKETRDTKLSQIRRMVIASHLFEAPQEHEGMPYVKGNAYLAVLLTASGWSSERIENALSELVIFNSK